VRGTVIESNFNLGKKDRPYWQVVVEVEGGFVCIYVRKDELRPIAERLAVGTPIEASGFVRPGSEVNRSKGPVWLDPVDQLRALDE
jgi:hypothetical protein